MGRGGQVIRVRAFAHSTPTTQFHIKGRDMYVAEAIGCLVFVEELFDPPVSVGCT